MAFLLAYALIWVQVLCTLVSKCGDYRIEQWRMGIKVCNLSRIRKKRNPVSIWIGSWGKV